MAKMKAFFVLAVFIQENMINGRKVAKFRDACTEEDCYTLDIKTTPEGNYATIRQNFNSSSTISEKRSEEVAASFVEFIYYAGNENILIFQIFDASGSPVKLGEISYEVKYINKTKLFENLQCSEAESASDIKPSCAPDLIDMNPPFSTCDDHDSLEDTGSFQKSVTLDLRNVSHPSPYYKIVWKQMDASDCETVDYTEDFGVEFDDERETESQYQSNQTSEEDTLVEFEGSSGKEVFLVNESIPFVEIQNAEIEDLEIQNSLNQEMILVNNDNIEDNIEKIEELETKEKQAIENLEFESELNQNLTEANYELEEENHDQNNRNYDYISWNSDRIAGLERETKQLKKEMKKDEIPFAEITEKLEQIEANEAKKDIAILDEELNKELIKSDEFTILVIAKNLVLYAIVVASLMTMVTIVYAVVRKMHVLKWKRDLNILLNSDEEQLIPEEKSQKSPKNFIQTDRTAVFTAVD